MPIVSRPIRTRKSKTQIFSFTATCASGLEELVAREMTDFGASNPQIKPGAVSWRGSSLESGYRACLWSRFASRILLELARFDAPTTDALYAGAGKVSWDEHLGSKNTFAISATLVRAPYEHSQYAALRVKDAIADQFRRRFGIRPNVDAINPDLRLHLYVSGTGATIALDLSGNSLHRRGYRLASCEAPLKETLAAALVHFSGWLEHSAEEPVLLDPMCGSGTLLIEAAQMLMRTPPGLERRHFGFMGWARHDHKLWEHLVAQALEKEGESLPAAMPRFIGYDADPVAVAAARKNVIAAGLRGRVEIHQKELACLKSPAKRGCIITNPPYGERLLEKETARYLYRCLGRVYREQFPGWRIAFFTANPEFSDVPAIIWQTEHKLYNGPIKCRLLVGHESRPAAPQAEDTALKPLPLPPGHPGLDFANRVRKNFSTLADWIARDHIHCFRLYDADLPDYNLAVDCYEEWLHVQEYAPPGTVDSARASERLQVALGALREVLQIPHSQIFIKHRMRQKGRNQYQKKAETSAPAGRLYEVREGAARFLVNFTDYLDTGLFLDHRPIRRRIQELAQGKTFLNLFGYTGTATVFAALGGATSTTTVDASEKYLARAAANLALNGFGGPLHKLVRADCLSWLEECKEQYGLIFVDPPTFSNSKNKKVTAKAAGGDNTRAFGKDRRGERRETWKDFRSGREASLKSPASGAHTPEKPGREDFDIQRGHSRLLKLVMQHLSPGGLVIFSTNFRKFTLDAQLEQDFAACEISAASIPPDFKRGPGIHRVWELRHAPGQASRREI